MSNDVALENMEKRTLIYNIRNRRLEFLGGIMCKKGLEIMKLTGHIKARRANKQRKTYLTSFLMVGRMYFRRQQNDEIIKSSKRTGNGGEP